MESFSVVVVSYNGKNFLRECLKSIPKSEILPKKIVAVDDFSDDGTAEMVKKEFSAVELIRSGKNFGPTFSRNRGAELVDSEYVIFLDNDVLVRPGTFKKLISFLKENPDAGIVGTKIVPESKEKIWWNMGYEPNNLREAAGYLLGFLLKFFPRSERLKNLAVKFVLNYSDYKKTVPVGWVIESCFAINKKLFDSIGGFDERFFMFFEGPDLCFRVKKSGLKVYFYPDAAVDSLSGHTHSKLKRAAVFNRSKYLFYKKHYFYRESNPVFFWIGKIVSGILYLIAK
jgi:hypothetical protein